MKEAALGLVGWLLQLSIKALGGCNVTSLGTIVNKVPFQEATWAGLPFDPSYYILVHHSFTQLLGESSFQSLSRHISIYLSLSIIGFSLFSHVILSTLSPFSPL